MTWAVLGTGILFCASLPETYCLPGIARLGQPAAENREQRLADAQRPTRSGAPQQVDPRVKRRLVEPEVAVECGAVQDAPRRGQWPAP